LTYDEPEFVDDTDPNGADDIWRTSDDGLALDGSVPSFCIDAGDDYAPSLPDYDIIGNDRTFDTKNDGEPDVDMGAYEYPDLL